MGDTQPAGPRILVVDDEPSIRALLERVLDQAGYRVETAADIGAALATIRDNRFDAIVLDVKLPGATGDTRSGLDILAFVRQQPSPPHVVVITAHPLDDDGMDQVLTRGTSLFYKPIQVSTLVQHLNEITGRAAASDASQRRTQDAEPGT